MGDIPNSTGKALYSNCIVVLCVCGINWTIIDGGSMKVELTEEGYTLDGKWKLVPVEPTLEMYAVNMATIIKTYCDSPQNQTYLTYKALKAYTQVVSYCRNLTQTTGFITNEP